MYVKCGYTHDQIVFTLAERICDQDLKILSWNAGFRHSKIFCSSTEIKSILKKTGRKGGSGHRWWRRVTFSGDELEALGLQDAAPIWLRDSSSSTTTTNRISIAAFEASSPSPRAEYEISHQCHICPKLATQHSRQ
ncbi:hypothetical protein ElyMa_005644500 [Elysia marginata]|uniref:Uncharacterized protein n=1 Tax=Elysia marginata TaxID=1093978 RepID=A0AAV4FAM8_9GAST|nr:hypothetical protein ElyMa_005644500 [Elysia marginata]